MMRIQRSTSGMIRCDASDPHSHAGVSFGGPTIQEAAADAVRTMATYLGLGYQPVIESAFADCLTCSGLGRVKHRRNIHQTVTCQTCHGAHPSLNVLAGVLAAARDAATELS